MAHLLLRFEFGKLKGYEGKYLTKSLCLSFSLNGEQHLLCETFALDTGSPLTILRQATFERVVGNPADYDLSTVEISGYGDAKEDAPYIENVDVSSTGGKSTG